MTVVLTLLVLFYIGSAVGQVLEGRRRRRDEVGR